MLSDSTAYDHASLCLMKHVEARQPNKRRFARGPDALWAQFRGAQRPPIADRIDTVCDADCQWPGRSGRGANGKEADGKKAKKASSDSTEETTATKRARMRRQELCP